jgi:hypothetical protein
MKLVICLPLHHDDIQESGGTAPCILNLGSALMWLFYFTLWHFIGEKKPPYKLDKWRVGPRICLDAVN